MRRLLALLVLGLAACGSDPSPQTHGSMTTSGGGAGGSGGSSTSSGAAGDNTSGGSGAAGEGGAAGAAGAPMGGRPPATLHLTGTAAADVDVDVTIPGEGGAAGASALPSIDRVECHFYADVLDLVEDDAGGWSGVAIGEVFRSVYVGEHRFEFSAFIGGPATLTAGAGDRVELRAVGDQTGAKPFWRALEVLDGETTAEYSYGGAWTCASLELNDPGFPDVGGVATGTWQLEPLEP